MSISDLQIKAEYDAEYQVIDSHYSVVDASDLQIKAEYDAEYQVIDSHCSVVDASDLQIKAEYDAEYQVIDSHCSVVDASKLQIKKQYDAEYRAKRKNRKHELIELHRSVVADENKKKPKTPFKFDFRSRRLLRSGKWETLPPEYARILKACEEFIDNPNRFPALNAWGGEGVNNIQCRRLVANVLACIIVNTDLIGGRIGLPTEAGLKTISYDHLQEDYALRFGRYISPKSFAKAISYLKRAGYLHSERVNVCVDLKEGTIRSAPAYKQFSERFFSDLKVVRYSNICQLIIASRKRQEAKGLRFSWVSFRTLANSVQEVFNADKLNDVAQSVTRVFDAYLPHPAPH